MPRCRSSPPSPGGDRVAALLTVGHGTLDAQAFGSLLVGAGVERLVDVRRHPGSRRWPHFARAVLAVDLDAAGVGYRWEEDLGGRRSTSAASVNVALRNASFRGYADYMATEPFRTALAAVVAEAHDRPVAVMCSESLWWRCHRRLLADAAVLLHELPVAHLMHDGRLAPHAPTDGVRRVGDHLRYDVVDEPTLPGM